MKTKVMYCEHCDKYTMFYKQRMDVGYSTMIGLFTAGLVIPYRTRRVCSVCGHACDGGGVVTCGVPMEDEA